MPLIPKDIIFSSGGRSDKITNQVFPEDKFVTVENVSFEEVNSLKKRTGHTSYGTPASTYGSGKQVFEYKDKPMAWVKKQTNTASIQPNEGYGLYSLDDSTFVNHGYPTPVQPFISLSTQADESCTNSLSIKAGDYIHVIHKKGNTWYNTVLKNGVTIDSASFTSQSASYFQLATFGDDIVILFGAKPSTNELFYWLSAAGETFAGSATSLSSDFESLMDACSVSIDASTNAVLVFYNKHSNGKGNISVISYAAGSGITVENSYEQDMVFKGAVCIFPAKAKTDTYDQKVIFAGQNNADDDIYAGAYTLNSDYTLSGATTINDIVTPIDTDIVRMAGAADYRFNITDSDTSYRLCFEVDDGGSNDIDHYVHTVRIKYSDISFVSSSGAIFYQMCMAGRPFCHEDTCYVPCVFSTDLQSTYFLKSVKRTGSSTWTDTKVLYGRAEGVRTDASPPPPTYMIDSNSWVFSGSRQARVLSDGIVTYNQCQVGFNFSPTLPNPISFGDSLLLGDGMTGCLDGSYVETGFANNPELISLSGSTSTGSLDNNGVYNYVYVYEFVSKNGRIWRSAPSPVTEITLGAAEDTVTATVYQPHSFDPVNQSSAVTIYLYRTTNGGSTFYKCSVSATAGQLSTTTIVDVDSDAELADNELLYTDDGSIYNYAPPASIAMTSGQNRIFLVSADERNKVYYSQEIVDNEGLKFHPLLNISCPNHGDITNIAYMDNKLFIFKDKKIYYTAGAGTNAALEGSFVTPELLPFEIGSIEGSPILTTDLGLIFKSHKGICLLTRSYSVIYIGENIEDLDTADINSMVSLPDRREIIFHLDNGNSLCWNVVQVASSQSFDGDMGRWSYYTGIDAESGVDIAKVHYYIDSAGEIFYSDTSFTDDSSDIIFKIKTGQMRLGGLAGYFRLEKIYILGEYKSPHTLNVNIYYQDETTDETISSVISSDPGPEIMEIRPKNPKAESMQLEIYDSSLSGSGESFSLYGLRLLFKPKRKIPISSTRRM